ncbi:hypothetical protein D3C72_1748880 [compost metagenome]
MVIHRMRERHINGRSTYGCKLSDRAGACPADHQIRIGKGLRRIFNKGRQLCLHTRGLIVRTQGINLLGTALMQHPWAHFFRDQCQSLRHHIIQRLGAQAATHHQNFERATAPLKPRSWIRLA